MFCIEEKRTGERIKAPEKKQVKIVRVKKKKERDREKSPNRTRNKNKLYEKSIKVNLIVCIHYCISVAIYITFLWRSCPDASHTKHQMQ